MTDRKRCYYYLSSRGFFSELYQLANAQLFALENNFELMVVDFTWNSRFKKGLKDYFKWSGTLPRIVDQPSQSPVGINGRSLKDVLREVCFVERFKQGKSLRTNYFQKTVALLRHLKGRVSSHYDPDAIQIMGHILPNSSWRHHWRAITTKYEQNFSLKTASGPSNALKTKRKIISEVWSFNQEISSYISGRISNLRKQEYCSIHIRRGDKVRLETESIPLQKYVDLILKHSNCKSVFVGTDDFSVIEELESLKSGLQFFYNTDSYQEGHEQSAFNQMSKLEIYEHIKNLLFEMEMHRKATVFVGTISSNLTKFLAFLRNEKKSTFSLDRRDGEPIFNDLVTMVS